MPSPTSFAALVDSSTAFAAPESTALSDSALMRLQGDLAEIRRRVDAWSASVAAQIARRSSHELGDAGLARRVGARTPELLVQRLAGTTSREAHTMVRVGALIGDASPLESVGAAVADGRISLDAADAIRAGLGAVDPSVPATSVESAAEELLAQSGVLTVEKLATRSREFGAELDEQHVLDRERALRGARYLRLTPQSDGMTRLSGLLDPESAAVVVATFDAVTSPRRGGPRFVDPAAREFADRVMHDERTTDQLTLDAFVDLVRLGADAAPEIVGAQRPEVRVLVTDRDLARRAGFGEIEGQRAPLSISTVERELCDRGSIPIRFDDAGQVVNLGRGRRLFTARQRIALAVRDGGCRFPGCDRPPSWCEAHHIDEWLRDHGNTDVADGVLLCRHHHLLLHNEGWRVQRRGAEYEVIPPESIDARRRPMAAPPKTDTVRRMLAAAASDARSTGHEQAAARDRSRATV